MISDVAILASLTYGTREVEAKTQRMKAEDLNVIHEEHEAEKAAKNGQSAAVRHPNHHASNKRSMLMSNNHQKEHHFHIQQPAGRK